MVANECMWPPRLLGTMRGLRQRRELSTRVVVDGRGIKHWGWQNLAPSSASSSSSSATSLICMDVHDGWLIHLGYCRVCSWFALGVASSASVGVPYCLLVCVRYYSAYNLTCSMWWRPPSKARRSCIAHGIVVGFDYNTEPSRRGMSHEWSVWSMDC